MVHVSSWKNIRPRVYRVKAPRAEMNSKRPHMLHQPARIATIYYTRMRPCNDNDRPQRSKTPKTEALARAGKHTVDLLDSEAIHKNKHRTDYRGRKQMLHYRRFALLLLVESCRLLGHSTCKVFACRFVTCVNLFPRRMVLEFLSFSFCLL